ncbi:MAG TPA: VIT1/CCC1 transporter family protein, partial [Nitrospiria bacterium]|nr:VIT1/CCC1 transporter family protein [Nitrospiria bacterium]
MDQTLRDKEIIVNHRLALEEHISWGKSAREILLGMSDGIITTLAFVAGVTGVIHDNHIILLTALAGISAGTISMFFSAYLSMKSQKDLFENEIKRETREIDEVPEIERQEIREIYKKKGFKGADLDMIVDRITSDKDIWVRSMMEEELKLFPEDIGRPIVTASLIGLSYIIGSLIPISPF